MKLVKKVFKKLDAIARDYFAPYAVYCDNGTFQLCWTMTEAEGWLKYCGKHAVIAETYDYIVQVQRVQK